MLTRFICTVNLVGQYTINSSFLKKNVQMIRLTLSSHSIKQRATTNHKSPVAGPLGIGHMYMQIILLRMTDTMTSQNIDLSSGEEEQRTDNSFFTSSVIITFSRPMFQEVTLSNRIQRFTFHRNFRINVFVSSCVPNAFYISIQSQSSVYEI
jgi:hypothetical protein